MRSLRTFKDDFGVVRKNGEEWLIKMSDTETHIPSVYEEVSHVVCILYIIAHFPSDRCIFIRHIGLPEGGRTQRAQAAGTRPGPVARKQRDWSHSAGARPTGGTTVYSCSSRASEPEDAAA